MARIITKELALKIAGKLGAKSQYKKGRPHDLYTFYHKGRAILKFGIRRGSEKDKGHDFIPGKIYLSPNEAKMFGQCDYDLPWYIKKMQEKGVIPPEPEKDE